MKCRICGDELGVEGSIHETCFSDETWSLEEHYGFARKGITLGSFEGYMKFTQANSFSQVASFFVDGEVQVVLVVLLPILPTLHRYLSGQTY